MDQDRGGHRASQIPFDLPRRKLNGRDDFIVAPSNGLAVSMVDRWPNWAAPWLALHGPEGSGKSHLAAVWAERAGAQSVSLGDLTVTRVPDLVATGALVLDADGHGGGPFDEDALFHLINLVKEEGAFLLLTAREAPAGWTVANAHLGSRLRAMLAAGIAEPGDDLLSAVIQKLFRDRQVSISEDVIGYIVPRMERSLRAANRLVERLDRLALERQKPVTKPLAGEVLSELEGPTP